MIRPAIPTRDVVSFGPFSLVVSERLLTRRSGAPVELGARTLDIFDRVGRPAQRGRQQKGSIGPGLARRHRRRRQSAVSYRSLRKALGDGRDGARYIATAAGRGYCFVAPISRSEPGRGAGGCRRDFPHANLPSRFVAHGRARRRHSRAFGSARSLRASSPSWAPAASARPRSRWRLDMISLEAFAGRVLFVDLGVLSDPDLVATALASMLGLSVQSDDATPSLIAYLRDKRILLILDTCEHLVDAVAALASASILAAPQVHILATSREALQVEGETRLQTGSARLSAGRSGAHGGSCSDVPRGPALRGARGGERRSAGLQRCGRRDRGEHLPKARRRGARDRVGRRDASRPTACSKPPRFSTQRLTLLWLGPRTRAATPKDPARHAGLELRAPSELERVVLRRLAVFVGHFTLDAALAVVTSATVDQIARFRRHRQPRRQVDGRDPIRSGR